MSNEIKIKSKSIVTIQDTSSMYKYKNTDEIDMGARLQSAYK